MVFSSVPFLFMFLPLALAVYYVLPRRFQNLFILISALFFYAWGEPKYIVVMLFSIQIDYFAGIMMWKYDRNDKVRKIALLVSVIMNIALLGLFKYGIFVTDNLNALGIFGTDLSYPIFKIGSFEIPIRALPPIGMSFFTFQSMSYTIDLYKRKIEVQKNPITFAAFVTLFPQLVAGPIVRYSDIAAELENRKISLSMTYDGIMLFITGMGKKVLIANNIGALWSQVKLMELGELSVLTAWLGIIAFTFQIYFDFSGYSDMAIGLGKMLGFNFPQNFNYPYISKDISEFWRRWHMTLGNWFKSYVYFPLGGSRKGLRRTVFNLAVVWLLTGIWHGASWNFIVWGCFYGLIIIAEKAFLGKFIVKLPGFIRSGYVMLLVILGWVLFDTANLPTAFGYMGVMFGIGGNGVLFDNVSHYALLNYSVILLLCVFACTNLWRRVYDRLYPKIPVFFNYGGVLYQAVIFVFVIAYLVDAGYNPFLYFNF
ncbi:MAG: MBOAT family protein [Oscillospiraceae bacterium]|jgi:alginate O-acetyltransferase complex protein AlgI|nr:MBOAT family protein [Oscillospiraceae bacterium]